MDFAILGQHGLEPVPACTRAPGSSWGAAGSDRLVERGELLWDRLRNLPLHVRRGRDRSLMVLVPEGSFHLGCDEGGPGEGPSHEEHLDSFYIDVHPVTVARWARYLEATGRKPPPRWGEQQEDPDRPVTLVGFRDAARYAVWAHAWLPSEAEWEKAARGPEGLVLPWGEGEAPPALRAAPAGDGDALPPPVGRLSELASPYGMEDAVGLILQWCRDPVPSATGPWPAPPSLDPPGPGAPPTQARAVRGSTWEAGAAEHRLTRRASAGALHGREELHTRFLGLRCVVPLRDLVDRVGY